MRRGGKEQTGKLQFHTRNHISTSTKLQRLIWLGHVERMCSERMPKMIYYSKRFGKKNKGRPSKRRCNSVIVRLIQVILIIMIKKALIII